MSPRSRPEHGSNVACAHPDHAHLTRLLLDGLIREGVSQREAAAICQCSPASLTRYRQGAHPIPATTATSLADHLAQLTPLPPPGLTTALVILGKSSPWTTNRWFRHRFDTMTLDVPYPDEGDIRDRVWTWVEQATLYGDRDKAQAAQFQRHRGGLAVPLTRKDERPHIEPVRRQIVVWGEAISRDSDIWLRVQFCPHDPDHRKFIDHLAYQLDGHWRNARVSRLDLALDCPGVLRDFVVLVDRVRKHQTEIEVVNGETFETWKFGHRGGVQFLRAYDRKRRELPERIVRFELEWKPNREDRPLMSNLPATPFGLTRRALVARPRDVPLSPLDLSLISGIQDFGWTPLYRDETKPIRRRLQELRSRLEAAEATFDLASEARVHWSYRLMCLRETLRLDRAGVPDPRWLHPGT